MSNYTKGTNFTAKDSLVTGNPSKLVKGSEIDAELNAISSAIATKADQTTLDTEITTLEQLVSDTAFSTALPAQTGNSGKLVTTDGTNASWTSVKTVGGSSILGSGDIATLPTQTSNSGKFLTTNGTSASWANVSIVLLATLTPTAAALVDALSTFSSTYDNYLIILDGIRPAADDTLLMRVANAGAADSGTNYTDPLSYTAGGAAGAGTQSSFAVSNGVVLSAGKGGSWVVEILNANDATNLKVITTRGTSQRAATPTWTAQAGIGAYFAANAVSGVRFYWSGGANFAAVGKIRIYGYNNT